MVPLYKVMDLPYGENPHQRAAYYSEAGLRRHMLSRVQQLNGKALSFNNLNDLSAARRLVEEFAVPGCVIVKHANPCGCAIGGGIEEAYDRAHLSDPVSAFGGVVVLNRPVEEELARLMATRFLEVVMAPGYSDEALAHLRTRENLRILGERGAATSDTRRAGLPPRAGGRPRPGRRRRRRRSGGDGDRQRPAPDRAALGRPPVRLARRQARHVERDRRRQRTSRRSVSEAGR